MYKAYYLKNGQKKVVDFKSQEALNDAVFYDEGIEGVDEGGKYYLRFFGKHEFHSWDGDEPAFMETTKWGSKRYHWMYQGQLHGYTKEKPAFKNVKDEKITNQEYYFFGIMLDEDFDIELSEKAGGEEILNTYLKEIEDFVIKNDLRIDEIPSLKNQATLVEAIRNKALLFKVDGNSHIIKLKGTKEEVKDDISWAGVAGVSIIGGLFATLLSKSKKNQKEKKVAKATVRGV